MCFLFFSLSIVLPIINHLSINPHFVSVKARFWLVKSLASWFLHNCYPFNYHMSFHCFEAGGTFFLPTSWRMMSGISTLRTFHNQNLSGIHWQLSKTEEHGQDHMIVNKFQPLSPEAKKLILYFSELPERQQALSWRWRSTQICRTQRTPPRWREIVPGVEDFWAGFLNPH